MTIPIEIRRGHVAASRPGALVVVIDVLRAFTTAQVALARGAREIRLLATVEEALALRADRPEIILAGEQEGHRIPGFQLGNSPSEMLQADVAGRVLGLRTSNGTQAALSAADAPLAVATGFRGARVVARWVREALEERGEPRPSHVELLATHPSDDDDVACAVFIRGLVRGEGAPAAKATIERILRSRGAHKFLAADQQAFPRADLDIAVEETTQPFVMRIRRHHHGARLIREAIA